MLVNIGALVGSQAVTWSMALVWTLVVPRALGPFGMGLLVTAWAATGILSVLVGLGTRNYLVRQIAVEPGKAGSLIASAIIFRAVLAVPCVIVMALYIRIGRFQSQETAVLYLATAAMLFTLLAEPFQAGFQALERMEYLAYGDAFNKVVQTLGMVVLVLLGFGVVVLSVWWVAVVGMAFLLMGLWTRPYYRLNLRRTLATIKSLVRGSAAYWAFGLFFMIYLWIDSVMLSLMASPTVVGWYGVPTKLFNTLMFVPVIVGTAWLPQLVNAATEGPGRLRTVARAPVELTLILGLPIAVGAALVAGTIIDTLYGIAFQPAVPVFVILAFCIPFMYLNVMVNQLLIAMDRQAVWTKVMIGATIVNPLFNFFLIRYTQQRFHNGALGAAASLLVTEALIVAVGLFVVREVLTSASIPRVAKALVATVAMGIVVYLCRRWGLVIQVPAGGLSFAVFALALRLPTPAEAQGMAALALGLPLGGRIRRFADLLIS